MAFEVSIVIRIFSWAVVLLSLIIFFIAYLKLPKARFRTIIGWLTIAFILSTLRWFGGRLVRNGVDFTAEPWFQWVWLGLIALAAVCTFIAARQMYELATDVHSLVGKPVHKEVTNVVKTLSKRGTEGYNAKLPNSHYEQTEYTIRSPKFESFRSK